VNVASGVVAVSQVGSDVSFASSNHERASAAVVHESLEIGELASAVGIGDLAAELDTNVTLIAFDLQNVAAPDLGCCLGIEPFYCMNRRGGLPFVEERPDYACKDHRKEAEAKTRTSLPAGHVIDCTSGSRQASQGMSRRLASPKVFDAELEVMLPLKLVLLE
jgi:hypothetical protein